jgi:hypothetical protein
MKFNSSNCVVFHFFEPAGGVTTRNCCREFFVELVEVFNGIGEQSGVTGFVCRYK